MPVLSIAVLPLAIADGKDDAYKGLGRFEAEFFPAAVAADLNHAGWSRAYFTPAVPPAGVDFVLKGTLVRSNESEIIVATTLEDASGHVRDTHSYRIASDDLKPPRKVSDDLPMLISNDIASRLERIRATDLETISKQHVGQLTVVPEDAVSAAKLDVYRQSSDKIRERLGKRQLALDKLASDRAAMYEQVRHDLWKMSEDKSSAESQRTFEIFRGIASVAVGLAAARQGSADTNTQNALAANITSSVMNASSESDRIEAVQQQINKSIEAFNSVLQENGDGFSLFGLPVSAGTPADQYKGVERILKAQLQNAL
jgi:hypothetical protein